MTEQDLRVWHAIFSEAAREAAKGTSTACLAQAYGLICIRDAIEKARMALSMTDQYRAIGRMLDDTEPSPLPVVGGE